MKTNFFPLILFSIFKRNLAGTAQLQAVYDEADLFTYTIGSAEAHQAIASARPTGRVVNRHQRCAVGCNPSILLNALHVAISRLLASGIYLILAIEHMTAPAGHGRAVKRQEAAVYSPSALLSEFQVICLLSPSIHFSVSAIKHTINHIARRKLLAGVLQPVMAANHTSSRVII